jgi:hypothetical protein
VSRLSRQILRLSHPYRPLTGTALLSFLLLSRRLQRPLLRRDLGFSEEPLQLQHPSETAGGSEHETRCFPLIIRRFQKLEVIRLRNVGLPTRRYKTARSSNPTLALANAAPSQSRGLFAESEPLRVAGKERRRIATLLRPSRSQGVHHSGFLFLLRKAVVFGSEYCSPGVPEGILRDM